MYIETVPNRDSPPAILLRESRRDGAKTHKLTLANLSHLPAEAIDAVRRILRGETLVPVTEHLEIERSWPHGHVAAVVGTIRRREVPALLAAATVPAMRLSGPGAL